MVTPRPIVRGPETATVTGPEGEEIYVDKYGRIKIQFHWDWGWLDSEQKGKKFDPSSCWVRVAQFGALGSIDHPRVGEEVLVDFINGNPDRPIVIGRVYNENTRHFLYELPKHKTMAVLRSKTYKKDGFEQPGDARPIDVDRDCQRGGSEIRIDDDTQNPQVFVYAEKNMDTRVSYCDTLQVGKDQKIEIGKNRNEDVYENETIVIHGKRDEHVKKTETVLVDQERKVTIKATDTLDVTDWIKVKSKTSTIDIEAPVSITLKVGMSSIKLEQSGITIKGPTIMIDGTTTTTVKSLTTTVSGSGMLTLSGGLTKINC
jgi:type VI secretion system secreted protein VgrG